MAEIRVKGMSFCSVDYEETRCLTRGGSAQWRRSDRLITSEPNGQKVQEAGGWGMQVHVRMFSLWHIVANGMGYHGGRKSHLWSYRSINQTTRLQVLGCCSFDLQSLRVNSLRGLQGPFPLTSVFEGPQFSVPFKPPTERLLALLASTQVHHKPSKA